MNLFSLLDRTARRWPDVGAVFHGTEQVWNWADLRARSLCLASALLATCNAGSRIAVASENVPQYPELMFGTWAARCAIAPINYKLHAREMAQIVEDAEPAFVFCSLDAAAGLVEALDRRWHERLVIIGSAAYEAMFDRPQARLVQGDATDLAWLFYTSGTTGRSKGAMLSQRNLMAMVLAHLADVETVDQHASLVHAAPMSHGSGLYLPAYVACGARQVVPASHGFDPAEFLALCDAHPHCSSFLAPTMVQRLRQAVLASNHRPEGLCTIVYGGGPMYLADLKRSLAVFGPVFVQIYGQGESPMTITWLPRADHAGTSDAVLGSVGLPRTGVELRIVGAEDEALPPGEVGDVLVRGDVVMSGYWRNPAGTAEALQDGWLRTGDVGALDANGYLSLSDRSKDVIISGGSNIYPREVEEVLLMHAGLLEASVVGQPDDEWGEVVVAFVVLDPAFDRPTPQQLDVHCLSRIARFKRPKHYVFLDELPKNSYGKVLKRELRQPSFHDIPSKPE